MRGLISDGRTRTWSKRLSDLRQTAEHETGRGEKDQNKATNLIEKQQKRQYRVKSCVHQDLFSYNNRHVRGHLARVDASASSTLRRLLCRQYQPQRGVP